MILPKSIRASHRWEPGVEFAVEDTPDGVLLRPFKPFEATRLQDVVGCTGYQGSARILEDMDAAIAARARADRDRG